MHALAVTTFLSLSLAIFAAPVSEAEASLQDLASASASHRRDAIPVTLNEPIVVPVGGLVERARGSRSGGEESAADPRKFKSAGGSRREAKTTERSMKNPGGGNRDDSESIKLGSPGGGQREAEPARSGSGGVPRDAAAQPWRFDIGKGHDRRDTIPGIVRPGGGTRPRDANPRGVRPGNGNNQRSVVRPGNGTRPTDVTAETVEARGRYRGSSRRV